MLCVLCNRYLDDSVKVLGSAEKIKEIHTMAHMIEVYDDIYRYLVGRASMGDEDAGDLLLALKDAQTCIIE